MAGSYYLDPRTRHSDRAPTLEDIIAMSKRLTWEDAQALATFDQDAMDQYSADAARKLVWIRAEIIRDLVVIAGEEAAMANQTAILGGWVTDDDQRAMLWRVCRRATWSKAINTMVCFGLTADAGLPYLTPQLRGLLTPIPMGDDKR